MATFLFKIVTPERIVYEAEVTQVTIPTALGEITVLPNHIPLVSQLVAGELVLLDAQGQHQAIALSGGFLQVHPGKVVLLADTAEMAHELDEARAAEAHARAKKLLATPTGVHDHDYAALKVLMDKELARLKVARKYKQRRQSKV